MEKTVRDLKIGNFVKTRVIPETQRYFSELMEISDIYGKESDEYKTAEKEFNDLWGERKGTVIQIGECFADCKIRVERSDERRDEGSDDESDNNNNNRGYDEIYMFPQIVSNFGHWNENSDMGRARFFIELEITD